MTAFTHSDLSLPASLDHDLIVADGAAPDIRSLVGASACPVHLLPADADPLHHLSLLLAGRPVHTLHLVAHGRAGAVHLGGQWIDAAALQRAASLLMQWPVARIALWSCDTGADPAFLQTLGRLTGAEVLSACGVLGRVGDTSHWQLQPLAARGDALHGESVFGPAVHHWAGQLGRVTVSFASGFVGTNTANNEATLVSSFGDLGWSNVQFTQNSSSNIFTAQGNDIIGSVLITDDNGVEHEITGYIKWRTPNGSVSTMVFAPQGSTNETLASDAGGFWGVLQYLVDGTSYIGLTFNGQSLSFNEGDTINGNAATSGLLTQLNNYLAAQPQLSVDDVSVNEADGTATFTVTLSTSSSDTVTVKYDTTDGSASAGGDYTGLSNGSLTFSPGQTSKTVSVTLNNDGGAESAETFSLVLRDPAFAAIADDTGVVTIADNDTVASLVKTAASGRTTEGGQQATFTVRLSAQPTATVTVAVSSNDTSEGTVGPASLTFTTANWNSTQTVTVTGVDDDTDDGDVAYAVQLSATSSDAAFNGLSTSVALTNDDDDTAGLTVGTISRHTTEGGQTATFTVRLASQPAGNVTVAVASDDTGEGVASPASLTFTSADWNSPRTVTVTGQDDSLDDGNASYGIDLDASSSDAQYNGRSATVSAVNDDDDSATLVLGSISRHTTEGGQTATFTVRLGSQPSSAVTVAVSSDDLTEGSVGPASLSFTTGNWNSPQTVTVTGVDDPRIDGHIGYAVNLAASSSDGAYQGLTGQVAVVNDDDDTASLVLGAAAGHTSEDGDTTTFTVRLSSEPAADVTVTVGSSDSGEGTLTPATLTFTPANWSQNRTVTATGVDDAGIDGAATYQAQLSASSADANFDGRTGSVGLVNDDNDSAGLTLSTASVDTAEDGTPATFTVRLNRAPSATVTLAISSSDSTEGTAGPATLSFTPANWNTPQTVTVTGADDADIDGDIGWFVNLAASSDDNNFQGSSGAVAVVTADDDSAGLVASGGPLRTSEAGQSDQLGLRLSSRPAADVTLTLTSSKPAEGRPASAALTFTPDNWNVLQTVRIAGVDDDIVDGSASYTVQVTAASTDPAYDGRSVDVPGRNADDDARGLVFSSELLRTGESGDSARLGVHLSSRPTTEVTVAVGVADATEGRVSVGQLLFTPTNWQQAQQVTVTGVDDLLIDGTVRHAITFATRSDDPGYNALNTTVPVDNADDDRPGLWLDQSALTTGEDGREARLAVRLTSAPASAVEVTLVLGNEAEGRVTLRTLTFTPDNWNQPQSVTVQGLDDPVADGSQAHVLTLQARSADPAYASASARVPVLNLDDDRAGLVIEQDGPLQTGEDGSASTFGVRLSSRPTGTVTVTLGSADGSEGAVGTTTLTFTPDSWDQPQPVRLQGVDDALIDGPVSWALQLQARSDDPAYDGLSRDAAVTNVDNDGVGGNPKPDVEIGGNQPPAAGDTARLLDAEGRVVASVVVTAEQVTQRSVVVNPPALDDGSYTFMAQVLDDQGRLRSEYPITFTVVTDLDGVMPSVEQAAHGGDFNRDGQPDWQQNNVGQLPLRSLIEFAAGRQAPADSFGAVLAGGGAGDGAAVPLDDGAQLMGLRAAAPPAPLPPGLRAAAPMVELAVTSRTGATWADADPARTGHQVDVTLDLPFGVGADELLLWSTRDNLWLRPTIDEAGAARAAEGGRLADGTARALATADAPAALPPARARLFDTDGDGRVDRVVLTLTDGGLGDGDGAADGHVQAAVQLAQRRADPVYSVLLPGGDRYLTIDPDDAAAHAQGAAGRFEGVWFDSLRVASGSQPLGGWHQPFTGDWTWATEAAALPYACYEPVAAAAGLRAAPAGSDLGAEVHLYLDGQGRTQLFHPADAVALGLAGAGYRDLGTAFRTTDETAFAFDPEGYLLANRDRPSVQSLVQDLAARFPSAADPGFVDAVEQHYLTQAVLIGLPHGDAADLAAVNAAFGTHFGG